MQFWKQQAKDLMNRDNFDGSTYDTESDLQMLGFCMYDNETGRFTTPDLLWSAFPAQTPYHYAYNSPLTYRDPSGLVPEKEKEGEELITGKSEWVWDGVDYGSRDALVAATSRKNGEGAANDGRRRYVVVTGKNEYGYNGDNLFDECFIQYQIG